MKPPRRCANHPDRPVKAPQSRALCSECLEAITAKMKAILEDMDRMADAVADREADREKG